MYLPITEWSDQNSILFPCGRNRRSNHVAPSSLPQHTLKLSLLLTLILQLTRPLPYILCLLTTPVLLTMLLLTTLLLLFIVRSLKSDRMLLLLTTRTPEDGFSPIAALP
jgi:hypothetical protein